MPARRPPSTPSRNAARSARRRQIAEAKQRLRELRIELSLLNHRVGSQVELKDVDFDCLDVITRHGPISPSALAGRMGVPLATMTGILDRLEAGGWIARDRAEGDRRAVLVRGLADKQGVIFRLYDGMNRSLDDILDSYTDSQLDVIVDFLRRCTDAGHSATTQLAELSERRRG
jgi:DNA-binding MarR family transcriptional regulator